MKQQVGAELAPVQLAQERLGACQTAGLSLQPANALPDLPRTDFAKMQVWREPRRGVQVGTVTVEKTESKGKANKRMRIRIVGDR